MFGIIVRMICVDVTIRIERLDEIGRNGTGRLVLGSWVFFHSS